MLTRHPRIEATLIGALALCLLCPAVLQGAPDPPARKHLPVAVAPGGRHTRDLDTATRVDANEIDMFLTNAGGFGRDLQNPGGPAGTFYPRGTNNTCLYASGLWLGGRAGSDTLVTVAEYSLEYQAGTMLPGGGWNDPMLPQYHVYKLTPESGPGDPDYDGWPVGDGAPLGRDGTPLRAGDQTLWSVFNDADPTHHTNEAGSCAPIGVQVAHLTYAYDLPAPLDRVILMDYRLWNRDATSLQRTFAGLWMDVDLGGANDDLVGSDSLLGTAYTYNGTDNDAMYGSLPPATAMTVLRAPGAGGNPIYAITDYINGTDPNTHVKTYRYMQGLQADGTPMIDPTTGRPTRYWHGGDPVAGYGWLDLQPTDKRNMVSMGPFDFAPGQVESLRVALVIGQGNDRIGSVKEMRDAVRTVRRLNEKGAFPRRSRWAIAGSYPNPYDPATDPPSRAFVVAPTAGRVFVVVVDPGNAQVKLLADAQVDPGIHPFFWDGTNDAGQPVPPGSYLFALTVLEPKPSSNLAIRDTEPIEVAGGRGSGPAAVAAPLRVDWDTAYRISVFDVLGRRVRSMEVPAGRSGTRWDGRDDRGVSAPAGVYLLRYQRGSETRLGRTVLLR